MFSNLAIQLVNETDGKFRFSVNSKSNLIIKLYMRTYDEKTNDTIDFGAGVRHGTYPAVFRLRAEKRRKNFRCGNGIFNKIAKRARRTENG